MDMDQAAVFLAGSILTALGFIVVVISIVIINNIFAKFWKPVKLFTPDSWTAINPPVSENEVNVTAPKDVK
jgi:hypothetical protein